MTLYTFDNTTPEIKETSFIAPNASLIGRVKIGENSSVWFNTVLRGDMENISIGNESNIQDLSMGHADPGFPLVVGSPAKVRKTYDESILENIRESAQIYVKRSISYRAQSTVV